VDVLRGAGYDEPIQWPIINHLAPDQEPNREKIKSFITGYFKDGDR
jgi:hypothetical protein